MHPFILYYTIPHLIIYCSIHTATEEEEEEEEEGNNIDESVSLDNDIHADVAKSMQGAPPAKSRNRPSMHP
jgi:hypothetical protein